jgi:uncharacterized spore protein YtfJ
VGLGGGEERATTLFALKKMGNGHNKGGGVGVCVVVVVCPKKSTLQVLPLKKTTAINLRETKEQEGG